MSNLERNKALAAEFLARIDADDLAGALALLPEDHRWWSAGKPEALPVAGDHSRKQFAALLRRMRSRLEGGLRIKATGMVAEGERVAVEVESRGELKNGRLYEQQYHMLMTMRDGKIAELKEYLDTQHVLAVWFAPQPGTPHA